MTSNAETIFAVSEKDMPATENAISKLFDGIEEIYFSGNEFNAYQNELTKMSLVELGPDVLESEVFKLKRQMKIVSKKITCSVIEKSNEFNKNVENLFIIQKDAEAILHLVRKLKSSLNICRCKYRVLSVVLAQEYKRRSLLKLQKELKIAATYHKNETMLRELMQGDTFIYIQKVVEMVNALERDISYSSLRQLSEKLLNLLKNEVQNIEGLLSSQIHTYNHEKYCDINAAYELIGKVKEMSEKVQFYFESTIHEAAFSTLVKILNKYSKEYIELNAQITYEELCKLIGSRQFARSLNEVGSALVNVLVNYHAFLRYHIDEDKRQQSLSCMNIKDESSNLFEQPYIVEKGIMQKSLIDNIYRIFKYASTYYYTLLNGMNLANCKFDQFVEIIAISERFRLFGHQHFGNPCPIITLALQDKTKDFFAHYHMERIDELQLFLQNETFTICPVPIQFTLFDLKEFSFLKGSDVFKDVVEKPQEICFQTNSTERDKQIDFILLESLERSELSPLINKIDDSPNHSCKSNFSNSLSFDSQDDESMGSFNLNNKSTPNLCNTALNLLRIIGRYVHMSNVLQSAFEQTIDAIFQLYYYFIYSMYECFCLDVKPHQQQQDFGIVFASLKLRNLMDFIQNNYFLCQTASNDNVADSGNTKLKLPQFCLDLDNKETLFSLAERIIGIESAVFLSKQMELLKPVLEKLSPEKKQYSKLDSFFKTLHTTSDLLESALGCVAAKSIRPASVVKEIQSIDWSISEIPSQHSAYVNGILKIFENAKDKMDKPAAYVHINDEVRVTLWSMFSACTVRVLTQCYSESNKCSNEGRALQLMDVENLCKQLEELIEVKPLPHRYFVENYVKAYFLPTDELNKWIIGHTEYTLGQTGSLLNACISNTPSSTKKSATMSRIMSNLLDASGIGDCNNPLFQ